MNKVQMIGINSERIYVTGEYRSDCMRKLHEQYPTFRDSSTRKRSLLNNQLYPEPLIIKKRDDEICR